MEIINYSLSVLIVFLGLIAGIVLAKINPEELKQGRKYFILLQKGALFIIFLLLLFFFKLDSIYIIISCILFLIFLYFVKLKKSIGIITYSLLAVILFISSFREAYFTYMAILIFIYGFPAGSLFYYNTKTHKVKNFLNYLWFIALAILPFLLVDMQVIADMIK